MLGEVLSYLEISKDNEEEAEKKEVVVPNLIGKTVSDAEKEIEELNLSIEIKKENEEDTKK